MHSRVETGERLDADKKLWWLRIDRRLQFRGGRRSFTADGVQSVRIDQPLNKALRQAHALLERCTDARGEIVRVPEDPRERMLIRLAFLDPKIQTAILHGRQPADLTLESLRRLKLPLAWDDQRTAIGG